MTRFYKDIRFYLLLIIILGAILRFFGLFNELCLDEVWSFNIVYNLKSPLQIFTSVFKDTNHHLNTLFIYLIDNKNPVHYFKYRVPSFIFGLATIFLGFLISKEIFPRRIPGLIYPFLLATSFPLVFYSTEARGYSPLIFFSLFSPYLLWKYFEKERLPVLLLFYAGIIMGFLSHLSFVVVAAALFISACIYIRGDPGIAAHKNGFATLAKLFFVPAVIVYLILSRYVSNLVSGGLTEPGSFAVINSLMMSMVGCVSDTASTRVLSVMLAVLLTAETRFLIRDRTSYKAGVFTATVIFLSGCLIIFRPFKYLSPRHLLFTAPFFLLLLSNLLYRMQRGGIKVKVLAVFFVLSIFSANMAAIVHFLKDGRGHYYEAMAYIYKNTASSEIVITSDHDFKNPLMINFYNHFYFNTRKVVYISQDEAVEKGIRPEWIIRCDEQIDPCVRTSVRFNGTEYMQKRHFPYWGLSGMHWFVYHDSGKD